MILRKWTGRVRTEDREDFCAYISRSSGRDSSRTPGNLGFQIVARQLDDGISEVTTLSWWDSIESIKAFAGDQPEFARYYDGDQKYILEQPRFIEHYSVIDTDISTSSHYWQGKLNI